MRKKLIKKIISGGQTGADRAGLEAAKLLKINTGGYCPKGYLTENGKDEMLKKFKLKELNTYNYEIRTVKNVLASDGTLIFCKIDKNKKIVGEGTILTYNTAVNNEKPVIVNPSATKFCEWLVKNDISILNVAGNRESQYPGIFEKVKSFLLKALSVNE